MANEDGPTGVGGWMWLFLFGFAVVSPILLIVGSFTNLYADNNVALMLGDSWATYQIIEWSIVALALAVIGYVVWRLFKVQNQQTVRLTQVAIPFVALGITLIDIMVTAVIAKIEVGLLFGVLGADLGRGVFYCIIWCSYFQVSKRVKNTYFERDAGEAAQVFE